MSTKPGWFARVRRWLPLVTGLAVGLLALVLPGVIFLTALSIQWVAFLVGVLVAASLALASRISRARWLLARRDAQLRVARERLARETRARELAQRDLAACDAPFQLLDAAMPVRLAYVDGSRRVRYLNRAFREWAGAPVPGAQGLPLAGTLPAEAAAALGAAIGKAFAGAVVRAEHPGGGGSPRRLAAQCVPHRGPGGEVAGVFVAIVELDASGEAAEAPSAAAAAPAREAPPRAEPPQVVDETRARIDSALAREDFSLFLHDIVRINPGSPAPPMREAILRLDEEEDYHLPPGGFITLVEEAGMMPALDAWQVRAVARWLGASPARSMQVCALNVTTAALADPEFPGTVRAALREDHVPASALCFIVAGNEVASADAAARLGLQALRAEGCRLAIAGFGASALPNALLRELSPEYVIIDAGLVVGMEADPRKAARVAAANRVAHACGAATIAGCVEHPAVLACLTGLGVDFAEGRAVSAAAPLCYEPAEAAPEAPVAALR